MELYLLAMEKRDLGFLMQVMVESDPTIKLLPTQQSWEELQKAVGGLDLAVSLRLHGLVAAVVQSIPCFGVAIDPKIEGFCLQVGIPFFRPTAKIDWLNLSNRILKYLYQPLNERKPWESQVPFWKARARENQFILIKQLAEL